MTCFCAFRSYGTCRGALHFCSTLDFRCLVCGSRGVSGASFAGSCTTCTQTGIGIGFAGVGIGMGTKIRPVMSGGADVGMILYPLHSHSFCLIPTHSSSFPFVLHNIINIFKKNKNL